MTSVSLPRALALAALLCVPAISSAADHRDAPLITFSSAVDINDVYMFRNPTDDTKLVMIMTTHPLGLADFAASYPYQPDAVYRFNFSINTQAVPTAKIDLVFSAPSSTGQTLTAFFPHGIKVTGRVTPANGTTGTPNEPIVNEGPQGIKIFAGPRDDPFFFDLVGFNRLLSGATPAFRPLDSFLGLNTNAIVVEFPISLVAGDSRTFSAWGVTFLVKKDVAHRGRHDAPNQLEQADRMGNPAVNTALIPSSLKDAFNQAKPQNDAEDFGAIMLATLTALGTNATNKGILASVAVPDTLKFNRDAPDGFPNGRRPQDDVIETLFSLILGAPGQTTGIDDGVLANDKPFLSAFPYLAPPSQPVVP
jgi:hypothetical protein